MADIIDWLDGSGHRLPTGEPNASGLLRVLDPGTQVEVPIFDAEGETISQPVELDAAGKAAVYVEGPVDLSFEDSTGASVDTMSGGNIHGATALLVGNAGFTGALASGSQGAGGRTYLDSVLSRLFATFGGVDGKVQESASAVPRLLVELLAGIQLSVKDFGAVGDGLSDDTTYIQLALNRCAARGGGRVYIDPGTYLISSAITIAANVSLVGAGSASSIIKLSNATANAVVVSAGGVGNNTLQGFQVTHSSSSSGTGVLCSATDHIVIRDVQVAPLTFANGVKIDACNNTAIYDSFLACTSAAPSRCLTYTTSGENHFVTNTEFRAALGACVEMNTSASKYLLTGCPFRTGVFGVIVTSTDNDDLIKVIGCHGLNDNISTAFSGAAAGALFQTGNNIDGYGVNVLSGATVVPDPLLKGKYIRIQGQTTGAAYVLGALAVNPLEKGFTFTIEFFNNAGGAVTGWTLNAMYHVAAAIPTADLAKTAVTFRWDGISSVCREVSRAQTI